MSHKHESHNHNHEEHNHGFGEIILTIISLIIFIIALTVNTPMYSLFLFALSIITGGLNVFIEGMEDLFINKKLTVHLLMVVASIGAFYIGNPFEGALLMVIFSISHALTEYVTNKSRKDINALLNKQIKVARKSVNGELVEVAIEELKIGDILVVLKGENIPIDSKIVKGLSNINESAITGESLPVEKTIDDTVYGGTLNVTDRLEIVVEKEYKDTVFANIIKLVEEAQNSKTTTQTFIEKFENKYVTFIFLAIPSIIFILYFMYSWTFSDSVYRGIVLLISASPCALVASTFPSLLSAISNGSRNGILFKNARYIEQFSNIKHIYFDKTGTLTVGEPKVVDSFIQNKSDLPIFISMETHSNHPIANSIINHFNSEIVDLDVENITSFGMKTNYKNNEYTLGKSSYSFNNQTIKFWESKGYTIVYLEKNGINVGAIALSDVISTNSKETIAYFKKQSIDTTMLTGDSKYSAENIANQLAIDDIKFNLLPSDKSKYINDSTVINAFVGDGINDAPSLANADVGIAMGKGTDIAMEVSDMVIIDNDLSKLEYSHKLSKKMNKIIKQNIIFSLAIIILLIIGNINETLGIPLAIVGHEGSTILVILNSLRLLKPIK